MSRWRRFVGDLAVDLRHRRGDLGLVPQRRSTAGNGEQVAGHLTISAESRTQIESYSNRAIAPRASSWDSKNVSLVLCWRHEARRVAGPLLLHRPHLGGDRRAVDDDDPARVLPWRAPLRPLPLETRPGQQRAQRPAPGPGGRG